MSKRYWLLKSEPEAFSIQDLARAPKQTTAWDGVRNYQARNLLRDELAVSDGVLFYHSNAEPSGVAGTAVVVGKAHPDLTQFDPQDDHCDPASDPGAPRWFSVDVKLDSIFKRFVPLPELRAVPALHNMVLFARSRLSVQPVTAAEWAIIVKLGS